jgi:hypothetical protein
MKQAHLGPSNLVDLAAALNQRKERVQLVRAVHGGFDGSNDLALNR